MPSCTLYELTKEDSTASGSDVVKTWAEKIGAHVGVYLRYSQRLLVRRTNYLRGRVRKCTGSIPRQRLLQQRWALELLRGDLQMQAMQDKIETLHAELAHAKEQNSEVQQHVQALVHAREQVHALDAEKDDVERELKDHILRKRFSKRMCSLSDRLRRTPENQPPKRGHSKSFNEYSEAHKCRLTRKRVNSAEESLLWMEKDGLEPVSVKVRNTQTGTTETIELAQRDSEQLLGPSEH